MVVITCNCTMLNTDLTNNTQKGNLSQYQACYLILSPTLSSSIVAICFKSIFLQAKIKSAANITQGLIGIRYH